MHPLFPYAQNTSRVTISGAVRRLDDHTLSLLYEVGDARGVLRNGPHGDERTLEASTLMRAHELWKNTCFELFWSEPGNKRYFECNVNTEGKWNIYAFDSYRNPQPPQEASQYRVIKVMVGEGILEAEIVCDEVLPPSLECGLTAIMNTTDGELFYATAHKGKEPDYHVRESFVISL